MSQIKSELLKLKQSYVEFESSLKSFVHHDFKSPKIPTLTYLTTKLPVKDPGFCAEQYSSEKYEVRTICVGYLFGELGACTGDSGSPIELEVNEHRIELFNNIKLLN
jgi:hypothetical protein